jgi:3-methyladenine DNA glycosylase/8-oxoguanine DNA glycosylase
MNQTTLSVSVPSDFSFWRTVYSHGWCALPPFSIDKATERFSTIIHLNGNTVVHCSLSDGTRRVNVEATSRSSLSKTQRQEIIRRLRACLRLDEDFSEFHREARRHPTFRWVPKIGAGRLLRAPSVFEDIVKMICTTNCTWALTTIMVTNLTQALGKSFNHAAHAFPTPEAMAGVTERFIRKEIRAGYRSPYLIEFAESVAGGKIEVEAWRSSNLPTEELMKQVRSIKGVGAYAAGNILKLLGRYDYLGLDSWVRAKYSELHRNGRHVSDRTIERQYAPFGKWRGLFFWLEMTRHWYSEKFPF